jgi:hypothetical protein
MIDLHSCSRLKRHSRVDSYVIIPHRIACRSRNEEHWSCKVFLAVMTNDKEKLDQTGMTVRGSSPMKDAL